MWSEPTSAWKVWNPNFLGDEIDPERASSAWAGHRDFVYDLIRWRQPQVVVELGTEYGCSLFAMVQALSDSDSRASVHGIDTWEGSPDSYEREAGPAIQNRFATTRSELQRRQRTTSLVEIQSHQSTFAEALTDFEEGSIDLLHIDGCHTFDAVKEDFETWLPKLAPNGLVLLHDVAPDSGLGSAEYFAREIEGTYPGFAFSHNFGLGVVFPKGTEGWDFLFTDEFSRWKEAYRFEAEARLGQLVKRDLTEMIEERDKVIDSQDRRVEQLEWEMGSMKELLEVLPRRLDEANTRLLQLEKSPKAQLRALTRSIPRSLDRRLRVRATLHRIKHLLRPRTRIRELKSKRQRQRLGTGEEDSSPNRVTLPSFEDIPSSLTLRSLLAKAASLQSDLTEEDLFESLIRGEDPSALLQNRREPEGSSNRNGERPPRKGSSDSHQRVFTLRGDGSESVGDLGDLVEQTKPDLISIDVWNTLIGRNRPADAAKTATGRRICLLAQKLPGAAGLDPFDIAELRREIEAEIASAHQAEEYELVQVLTELLLRLGHPEGNSLEEFAATLAEAEVQDEITWSHTLEDVHALVRSTGTETVLLSDFYMAREHLGTIVREVTGLDVEVIVSADVGASKRLGGGLFERLRTDREVPAGRHLHVGDHPQADIENQTETGGVAVFVPAPDDFPPPGSFNREDLSSCWQVLDRELEALASVETDPFRRAGIELSPLATLLVNRAIEEAQVTGVDRIHYLSREGSFLAKVHEVVEPILRPPGAEAIKAVHLPLSRRSTFAASLEEPFLDSVQRMWTMYATQTVEAMLLSLGLDPEACAGALGRVGLDRNEELEHASSDPRVQALFGDQEFSGQLREHVIEQRSALKSFVADTTECESPFLMVDIGWRGTIQDNLVRALGIERSIGFYLGLFPFLNPQPDGSRKEGVAFDANLGEEFGFAEPPGPVERAWTPDIPSMVGFERSSGSIEPVWQGEEGSVSSGIEGFQEGTLSAAPEIARWLVGMGLTTSLLRNELRDRAMKAWLLPPPGVADIWFGSEHDDTFGGLSTLTYEKLLPEGDWLDRDLRECLEEGRETSGWSSGYIAWAPIRGLISLVGLLSEEGEGK